jgi:Lamin Tail Domain
MNTRLFSVLVAALLLCSIAPPANAQGRVVLNEYLPWPSNGCGVSSEFVELLNFGPGPMNIGDYAITIPANTILQPGQFYVIAGMDVIPAGCANINGPVTANLNWNTCNCTSAPIPATGDGFFTDGGSANEQLVLLDASGQVIDAVVRSLPVESSASIITSDVGGGCDPIAFNLDNMNIVYETIGESAGRGNSFARKIDGDCGWLKDTQQSGGATNNTPGESSWLTATLNITNPFGCNKNGSVAVSFRPPDYALIFPVRYILAYDADSNGVFDFADTYTYGIDSVPPLVNIDSLRIGFYRLLIEPAGGCSPKLFPFSILPCINLLRSEVLSLTALRSDNKTLLRWQASYSEEAEYFVVEQEAAGQWRSRDTIWNRGQSGTAGFAWQDAAGSGLYRIQLMGINGRKKYSDIVRLGGDDGWRLQLLSANPVQEEVLLGIEGQAPGSLTLTVSDAQGRVVLVQPVRGGVQTIRLAMKNLGAGMYQISAADNIPGNRKIIKVLKR